MAAYEILSGTVTAAGATLTNWTLNGNDSLRLRNTIGTPYLLNCWTDVVVPGQLQITSQKMHDAVDAILLSPSGNGEVGLPIHNRQKLYPADLLQVQQSGSAGAGDIDSGAIVLWYDQLPGLDQNLINFGTYKKRFKNFKTVPVNHTPSVTGGYGGAVALTNIINDLKGNTEYAVIGFDTNNIVVGCITFQGPDTRGLRIPIPFVNGNVDWYHAWFPMLAEAFPDDPMIPVINADNKTSTFIESVHSSVFAPPGVISLILAELY